MDQPSATFTRYPPHDTRIQAHRETIATCRDTVKRNPNEMAGKERNVRQIPMRSYSGPLAMRQSYPSLLIDVVRPFLHSCTLSSFGWKPESRLPDIRPASSTSSQAKRGILRFIIATRSPVLPTKGSSRIGLRGDNQQRSAAANHSMRLRPVDGARTCEVCPHPPRVSIHITLPPTPLIPYTNLPTVKHPNFQSSQGNFQRLS